MNKTGAVTLGRAGVAPVETTLARFDHPVLMNGAVLIDDPVADRLRQGDPAVGWEGDMRLGLYLHRGRRQWELWRFEHDATYHQIKAIGADGCRGIDAVGQLIVWLITHDSRRGFSVVDVAYDNHAQTEAAKDYAADQVNAEGADRLAHALIVDGVQPRDFWAVGPTKAGRRA